MKINILTTYNLTEKPLITRQENGAVSLHDVDWSGSGGFSLNFPRQPWALHAARELVAALEDGHVWARLKEAPHD